MQPQVIMLQVVPIAALFPPPDELMLISRERVVEKINVKPYSA
jgi:hypothetical protein